MTNSLINILLFVVGNICVRLETLEDRARGDCWHLWVGKGFRFLVHNNWLTAIAVG